MHTSRKIVEFRSLTIVALASAAACGPRPAVAPMPMSVASFVAVSPNNSATPPRDQCWLAGRLQGIAIARDRELEIAISHGWIAVTRDNNKQWDDLHLVTEISAHPLSSTHWAPVAKGRPIVLQPTVDSAGPQLTTWETQDTLLLLLPRNPSLAPRWLFFRIDYKTLSYAGRQSTCEGILATDTLRFTDRP